jgi:hypothetical protein
MGLGVALVRPPVRLEFLASVLNRCQFSVMRNFCLRESRSRMPITGLADRKSPLNWLDDFSPPSQYNRLLGHRIIIIYCETWSLVLRNECRLRVFEKRTPRKIFRPKRDENGKWRKLYNGDHFSLYRSSNTFSMIKYRRLT